MAFLPPPNHIQRRGWPRRPARARLRRVPALSAACLLAFALVSPGAAGPPTELDEFFTPPAKYKGKLGDYRPLLVFDDGAPVKTAGDWPHRREEILRYWHQALGPWPPLIEKPRLRDLEGGKEHVENFTRRKVEVEVAPDTFAGPEYLLVPDGEGPFPAVVVTWYNSADSAGLSEKCRGTLDFGYQLAKRGFVALCIGGLGEDPARRIQPLSFLAYAAANSCRALSAGGEVDRRRIGIVGHSFGGKWAMIASCLYDGFACAVWIDPGIVWNEKDPNANYWEKWYFGYDFDRPADRQRKPGVPDAANPRTGAYQKLLSEGHDLHELHALMAPRPFLVSGGAQDRPEHWIALNHAIAVNELLGQRSRVAMTMREGHDPTAKSNEQVYAFLERFLKYRQTTSRSFAPPPAVNFREPERRYVERQARGRIFYLESALAERKPLIAQQAADRLSAKIEVALALFPAHTRERLNGLSFFVLLGPDAAGGGRDNGTEYFRRTAPDFHPLLDPRWRSAVVVYCAENYLIQNEHWAVLALVHEFAHAWQLENWPEKQPEILAAWKEARAAGLYRGVKTQNGKALDAAYAVHNQLEYFAELSGAYFWRGEYEPFDQDALRRYDPGGFAMIEKMWGIHAPPPPASKRAGMNE